MSNNIPKPTPDSIFLEEDYIDTAIDAGLFTKVRLGFIIDGIQYHLQRTIPSKGYWVIKV